MEIEGYEIHMGQTVLSDGEQGKLSSAASEDYCGKLAVLEEISGKPADEPIGMCSGNVYGSYIHGIFDSENVAKTLVTALCKAKGVDYSEISGLNVQAYKEQQYDLLAKGIRENIDMKQLYQILDEGVK